MHSGGNVYGKDKNDNAPCGDGRRLDDKSSLEDD